MPGALAARWSPVLTPDQPLKRGPFTQGPGQLGSWGGGKGCGLVPGRVVTP